MDNVDISIGGRRFRLQCGPGEVQRVQQLARLVDQCAASLIQGQGGMGEEKVLLLSILMVADRLEEAKSELERLRCAATRTHHAMRRSLASLAPKASGCAGPNTCSSLKTVLWPCAR